ncbi:MAG: hypothetical protein FWF77_09640 [Defluviitaleaceae bacterium]|nr:hypothetical protein [Defluviitaleaceae bacterium]
MADKVQGTLPVAVKADSLLGSGQEQSQGFDLSTLEHVSPDDFAKIVQRGGSGALRLNVVYSQSNGRRVKLSKALHEKLESPSTLQVAKKGDKLIIAEKLSGASKTFDFAPRSDSTTIYNAGLAKWLIDTFSLDFPSGRTSRSYGNIRIETQDVEGAKITFAVIDFSS